MNKSKTSASAGVFVSSAHQSLHSYLVGYVTSDNVDAASNQGNLVRSPSVRWFDNFMVWW
jgi:hypothetical protein